MIVGRRSVVGGLLASASAAGAQVVNRPRVFGASPLRSFLAPILNLVPTPILTLNNSPTAYPPDVGAKLGAESKAGDVLQFRYSADPTFATGVTTPAPIAITDAQVDAFGTGINPFSGITSGVNYIQVKISGTDWSQPIMHGDGTAPSLTSSLTPSGYQNIASSMALTADKPFTFQHEGGLDADDFYLTGSPIAGWTLNWYQLPVVGNHRLRFRLVSLAGVAGPVQELVLAIAANQPNAVSFADATNATPGSTVASASAATISGLVANSSVPISVSGGEYRINGGAWTSTAGQIKNNDTFEARGTAPATNDATTTVTINAGGRIVTFNILTPATNIIWDTNNKATGMLLSAANKQAKYPSGSTPNDGAVRALYPGGTLPALYSFAMRLDAGNVSKFGIIPTNAGLNTQVGYNNAGIGYWNNGLVVGNNAALVVASGSGAVSVGTIITFCVDRNSGRIWIHISGYGWAGGFDPGNGNAATVDALTTGYTVPGIAAMVPATSLEAQYNGQTTIVAIPAAAQRAAFTAIS